MATLHDVRWNEASFDLLAENAVLAQMLQDFITNCSMVGPPTDWLRRSKPCLAIATHPPVSRKRTNGTGRYACTSTVASSDFVRKT